MVGIGIEVTCGWGEGPGWFLGLEMFCFLIWVGVTCLITYIKFDQAMHLGFVQFIVQNFYLIIIIIKKTTVASV